MARMVTTRNPINQSMERFSARLYSYSVLRQAEFSKHPSNPLKFAQIAAD